MILNNIDIEEKIPSSIQVSRFDMAINFYEIVKIKNEIFLKVYDYNPTWQSLFPFYDDVNKTPLIFQSKAQTYKELINEYNEQYTIDLDHKTKLAVNRYYELTSEKIEDLQKAKNFIIYELKYSKTANQYTLYKLYNYITYPKSIDKSTCKLINISSLPDNLVDNAKYFLSKEFMQ